MTHPTDDDHDTHEDYLMRHHDHMRLKVREACKRRTPLDGTDAQALEHALSITERERDAALARAEKAEAELARLREGLEKMWQHRLDFCAELAALLEDRP